MPHGGGPTTSPHTFPHCNPHPPGLMRSPPRISSLYHRVPDKHGLRYLTQRGRVMVQYGYCAFATITLPSYRTSEVPLTARNYIQRSLGLRCIVPSKELSTGRKSGRDVASSTVSLMQLIYMLKRSACQRVIKELNISKCYEPFEGISAPGAPWDVLSLTKQRWHAALFPSSVERLPRVP